MLEFLRTLFLLLYAANRIWYLRKLIKERRKKHAEALDYVTSGLQDILDKLESGYYDAAVKEENCMKL